MARLVNPLSLCVCYTAFKAIKLHILPQGRVGEPLVCQVKIDETITQIPAKNIASLKFYFCAEWLAMVRSTHASLDGLLERFGLVKLESKQSRLESQHSKDLAVAAAMASSVNVNPNINITGPTITNNPSISVNTGQTVAAAASPAGATAGAPAQAQYQPPIAPGLPVEQAPQKLAEQQAQYLPPPGYAMQQGQYMQQAPPGYVPHQYAQYQQAPPPGYVPAGYVPAGYVPAPQPQQQSAPAVPQQ